MVVVTVIIVASPCSIPESPRLPVLCPDTLWADRGNALLACGELPSLGGKDPGETEDTGKSEKAFGAGLSSLGPLSKENLLSDL